MKDEKTIEKEYIVIALDRTRGFKKLINCEVYDIQRYVQGLPFGTEITMYFFSVEKLDGTDTMDTGDAEAQAIMNNEKSFYDFNVEINKIISTLKIKIDKENAATEEE